MPLIENGSIALAIALLRWGTAILLIHTIRNNLEREREISLKLLVILYIKDCIETKKYIGKHLCNKCALSDFNSCAYESK